MDPRPSLEPYSRGPLSQWLLMAFLAGSVNAGGFMACERFVTHVTGFATLFGVHLAQGGWVNAFGMLSVPVYFLLGCMVSAFLTDTRIIQGRSPRYGLVMGLVAGLLGAAALLGHFGRFGGFGLTYELERDYVLVVLLCAASGLQNAAVTTATNARMRVSHLTGLTTDLGIGLMRALFAHHDRQLRIREFHRTWLRCGIISAFIAGGAAGAVLFLYVDYLGFLLPAALTVYCGNLGLRPAGEAPGSAEAHALPTVQPRRDRREL